MCRAFSCIVTRDRRVLWKAGIDSHTDLLELNGMKDDKADDPDFARVEVTPDDGYLRPEGNWTVRIDGPTPRWWKLSLGDLADRERKKPAWKVVKP